MWYWSIPAPAIYCIERGNILPGRLAEVKKHYTHCTLTFVVRETHPTHRTEASAVREAHRTHYTVASAVRARHRSHRTGASAVFRYASVWILVNYFFRKGDFLMKKCMQTCQCLLGFVNHEIYSL